MSDLKATLAETLRAALVSVHPFNGEDYPSWFRDWIDQAAPEAAEAVLGLSGVAVTQLPEGKGSIRDDVAWLSAWNDKHAVPESIRMLKISEEYGEATDAYLGYLGANPRKGITNGVESVWLELADTALAALVAIDSLGGDPEGELLRRIAFVKARLENTDV